MSPQLRKVHRALLLPIADQFPLHRYYLRCLSVWCRFVLDDLWCGVLPTTQFAYRKDLGTCDALLCVSHSLQSALESGQEARIVQIDFSAAFGRVNHQGVLCKLCSVAIGGSVLSVLTKFLTDHSTLW